MRKYLQHPSSKGKVLVKLDFKNAFNSIRRDVILNLVKEKLPDVYNYVNQCYAQDSLLLFGDETINSSQGVQQGDPLGPFLYFLGTQDLVNSMNSPLNVWYLDDVSLGGEADLVLQDILKIKEATDSLGLQLNTSQCEMFLIGSDQENLKSPNSTGAAPFHGASVEDQSNISFHSSLWSFPDASSSTSIVSQIWSFPKSDGPNLIKRFNDICAGIRVLERSEVTLLGSPIFHEAVEPSLQPKLENLNLMVSRLKQIDNHDALFLLRHCFGMPKLTYFLRSAPCFLSSRVLEDFDKVIKESLVDILNIHLSDLAYSQLTLPIAKGGLGLRLASEIAISGYLSSVSATNSAVDLILPPNMLDFKNDFWESAFGKWKIMTSQNSEPSNPSFQSSWDKEIYDYNYQNLLLSAPTKEDRARILAVSSVNSSDWLHAIPIPSLGLKLDPMTIKVSCSLRLGSPLCHQYTCVCGREVEPYGRHGLSCKLQIGRRSRHDEINSLMKRALVQAKIPAVNEPSNLIRSDGKRPDGLTLTTWKYGRNLIWDVTVADTLCQTYVNQSSKLAGAAADLRESQKTTKYKEFENSYHFISMGIESLGSWGTNGHKLVKEIGKKVMEATGEK